MSSPTEAAARVKSTLMTLIDDLNKAGRLGVKIEFGIETDGVTLQSKLARFEAFNKMKLEN